MDVLCVQWTCCHVLRAARTLQRSAQALGLTTGKRALPADTIDIAAVAAQFQVRRNGSNGSQCQVDRALREGK